MRLTVKKIGCKAVSSSVEAVAASSSTTSNNNKRENYTEEKKSLYEVACRFRGDKKENQKDLVLAVGAYSIKAQIFYKAKRKKA